MTDNHSDQQILIVIPINSPKECPYRKQLGEHMICEKLSIYPDFKACPESKVPVYCPFYKETKDEPKETPRTRNEPTLTSKEAAAIANKILGFRYYREQSSKNFVSPLKVLILEKYAVYNGSDHKLTKEGESIPGIVVEHYQIKFTRRAGVNFLVDWARIHQEKGGKKE